MSSILRRVGALIPEAVRERIAKGVGLRPVEDAAVTTLRDEVGRRLAMAAREHEQVWCAVKTREDWERFRDARIAALRDSLGPIPEPGNVGDVRIVETAQRDGTVIDSIVLPFPNGVSLTADLYRPENPGPPGPGIVLCHSHHADRTQADLREMGLLWSRVGCVVLVPDLTGHGERRLHPFHSAADYRLPFKLDRQDYYFRFNLGMQLALAGHSLMGWMVGDVRRALDLIAVRPDVDPERLLLIGSVAGGGDVAAVVAALDPRVTGLVAFGFRGEDVRAEAAGGEERGGPIPGPSPGSWESTRCLRRSAADGFLPWVALASLAPRPLVYGHEFSWDPDDDPVWDRLRAVYRLYDAEDRLDSVHGRGSLQGPPPHNTHCTNVGPVQRSPLHPILHRWFDIPLPDEDRLPRVIAGFPAPTVPAEGVSRILPALADELAGARGTDAGEGAIDPARLREGLARLLGIEIPVDGRNAPLDESTKVETTLLWPRRGPREALPCVVGFCQQGGAALGRARKQLVSALRTNGVAVCLCDLRGTGPARDIAIRGRHGAINDVAAAELMLGRTLLGARLGDLLDVVRLLRARPEIDPDRVVLWGDSLARPNPPGRELSVPFDAGHFPTLSEPLGGLLALLAGLFDKRLRGFVARGGLASFRCLLDSPSCHVPADVIVPAVLELCDVDDLDAALEPRPLLLDGRVDGLNRAVEPRRSDRDVADWILNRAIGPSTV